MYTRLLKSFLIISVTVSSFINVTAQQSGSASAPTVGTLTKINPEKKIKEEDMQSKEISKEMSFPRNGEVFIESNSHNVIVKTWDQQKVKITTTVYYEGDGKKTDEEFLETAGISLKVVGSSVKIKSVYANSLAFTSYNGYYSSANRNFAMAAGNAQSYSFSNPSKKRITIMIPSGSKVDIESKYADINLPLGISEAIIDITNGNLDADNLDKLNLRSKYASVNVGNVKNAEIEMTNGRFSGGNMDELDIETKYSSVEIARVEKMVVRSTNDEYEIEEIADISGRKNYGNLRVTKLYKTIDLEGANADIKIRSLAPTVSLIKIDNKYADIRIPLKNVKNYQVDFIGFYSTVYGSFEKQSLALSEKERQYLQPNITSLGKLNQLNAIDRPSISSLGTLTNITVTGVQLSELNRMAVGSSGGNTVSITSGTLTSVAPAYVFSGRLSQNTSGSTTVASANNLTVTGNVTYVNGQMVPNTVTGTQSSSKGTLVAGTIQGITPNSVSAGQSTSNGTIVGGTIQGIGTPTITATTVPGISGSVSGGTFYPTSRYNYAIDNDTPTKFTSTVGDGKGLKIDMKCLNCTIDFK